MGFILFITLGLALYWEQATDQLASATGRQSIEHGQGDARDCARRNQKKSSGTGQRVIQAAGNRHRSRQRTNMVPRSGVSDWEATTNLPSRSRATKDHSRRGNQSIAQPAPDHHRVRKLKSSRQSFAGETEHSQQRLIRHLSSASRIANAVQEHGSRCTCRASARVNSAFVTDLRNHIHGPKSDSFPAQRDRRNRILEADQLIHCRPDRPAASPGETPAASFRAHPVHAT